jgi:hypothetical protein
VKTLSSSPVPHTHTHTHTHTNPHESAGVLVMPVIPTLGRLRLKDCEFKVSLSYIVRPLSSQKKKPHKALLSFTLSPVLQQIMPTLP